MIWAGDGGSFGLSPLEADGGRSAVRDDWRLGGIARDGRRGIREGDRVGSCDPVRSCFGVRTSRDSSTVPVVCSE